MTSPYAFICHASEDKAIAEQVATDLRACGIETFFDKWEIRSGQSLRQRIDTGLESCTHFVALLSPVSLTKEWVKTELDAGFMRRINAQASLIAVRIKGLEPRELPPLINGLLSPSLDDYATGIKTLIEDIHGIAKKPPLGAPSQMFPSAWGRQAGLSVAAARMAELFLLRSKLGRPEDPEISVVELRELTGYSDQQLIDAVDELEEHFLVKAHRVVGFRPFGYRDVRSTEHLFEALDGVVMKWKTEDDARTVATVLLNDSEGGGQVWKLADQLEWEPRRMNPALAYLRNRDLILPCRNLDPDYVTGSISPTAGTRRFVRS